MSYGFTQVSDHAMQAVLLCAGPRISSETTPDSALPPTVICAWRAGKKQLYTPWVRPEASPAGLLSMYGVRKSCQLNTTESVAADTCSLYALSIPPDLLNSALITGSEVSPNSGNSMDSISSCT